MNPREFQGVLQFGTRNPAAFRDETKNFQVEKRLRQSGGLAGHRVTCGIN